MSLRGQVAIVTGGSRGIGLAIARALAAEGAEVALAARSREELEGAREAIARDFGVRCVARPTDVAVPEQVDALVQAVADELGSASILVNNAGTTGAIGELVSCELAAWRRAVEVNLFGTVAATRAVLPAMRARGGGKIINLSGGGVGGPAVAARVSAYAASKAAVVQFTESIAREVAAWNVQVNAVAPGAVVTEMTAQVIAAGRERAGEELYERTLAQRAAGGDSPELAARLAVWLASPASGGLTGKLLSAKWDRLGGLDTAAVNQSSRYALRRIDGVLFEEVAR